MKNFFLKTGLTLLCLIIGLGSAWGDTVTFTPSSDKAASSNLTTLTKSGITLTVTDGTLGNGTDYRVYKSQALTISSSNGKITKIALTYTSTSYDGGGWATTYNPNSDSWTSPIANGEQARIQALEVTYSSGTTKNLSSIAVKTAPTKTTYTEDENFDSTGLVITGTYSDASTEDIAYAEHESNFSFNPAPTTALSTSNTSVTIIYGGKSVDQAITVNAAQSDDGSQTATYIFNTDAGLSALGISKPSKSQGTDLGTKAYVVSPISMTATNGSTATRVWNSNGNTDLRVYKSGGSLTFTGATITKIDLTGNSTDLISANVGAYSNNTWTGSAPSVTLSATTGTANINTITVTYTPTDPDEDQPIPNFIPNDHLNLLVNTNYDITDYLNIPQDYDADTYAITTKIDGVTHRDNEFTCIYPNIVFEQAGDYTVDVKAVAIPGTYAETTGQIYVHVTAPAATITTISDLFTKATEVGGTDTDINLTLNNWVVSGVKDSNAYVTDGTNGFIIYHESHGFTAGDVLNGTVACKVLLYNGSAEIVGLTSTTTGLTVSTSVEELTPTVISDLTTLSGVNTGALIKINNVQYDGTNFTDGTNSIKPYNGIMTSLPELTNGAYYNVTGVYVQYNTTKDIAPRSAEDIEEVQAKKYAINIAPCENGTVTASLEEAAAGVEVTLTVTPNSGYQLSTLAVTNASTSEEITATSNKFIMPAADVNVTATFEEAIFYESFDNNDGTGGNDEKWSGSIASNNLKFDKEGWNTANGSGAKKCAKFGSSSAKGSATTPALNYAGGATLTFKAGAWNSSTEGTTLNISIEGGGSASPTSVTLTKGAWDEYTITLTGLTTTSKIKFVAKNTSNNRFFLDEVTVTKSSITPATEYEITIASDIENGTISASKAKAEEGDDVTITATPATGYQLATLYYTIDGDETQNTIENLTFTMPANNVTIHATFAELARYTVTFDPQAGTCEEPTLEETVAGAGVSLPAAICLNKDYEFAGWATEVCEETTTMPTLYPANSTYNPTSDITLYAVYTNEGGTADNKFDKLTNLADLKSGDEIVIVNNASNYVLDGNSLGGSTTQSTIADAASIYVSDASKIWTAKTTGSNEWQFETTNTAKIGLQSHPGTGNRAYVQNIDSYNTWNIVEHDVDDCWTIINANGGAAIEIEYDEKYQDGNKWYAINEENPDIDEYCANRIYVKAPGAAQIYNSNPCEFLALKAIDDDKATRWATYSNDENDVEFIEGASVYSVTAENGKITLYEESDIVPAGTGILLKFNDTSVRYVTTENAGALKNTNNMLRPSSAPMNDSGYKYYKLAYEPSGSKTGLGFYYGAEDGAPFVSAAGLAYLAIPASQEIRGFSFEEALIETAISNVTTEVMPSANTYDLQGRLTKANTRGLFIVNGKKIIK